ncbi:MAG: hypothetical protein Q9227_007715 [Pyrenula ochraceoflavens]
MGAVSGWDDPRFPTFRGIIRRGMTVSALREFMLLQGPSKNIVNMDWTVFWAMNKKAIDPIAPRHTAIASDNSVKCFVRKDNLEITPFSETKPKHGKNPSVGEKQVWYGSTIWIEQEDALSFEDEEEITLMNWGNAFVKSKKMSPAGTIVEMGFALHPDGDFKTTKKKITWLSNDQTLVPVTLVDFEFLLTVDKLPATKDKNSQKDEADQAGEPEQPEDDEADVGDEEAGAKEHLKQQKDGVGWTSFLTPKTEFRVDAFADCNAADLKEGDIVQFERKGYFRCDKAAIPGSPAILFNIPTGKTEKPKQGY